MRRTCLMILFCLFAITAFGQDKDVSNDQPPIKFHYALVGSADGIDAEISFDKYLFPSLLGNASKDDLEKLAAQTELSYFGTIVTNETDQNIELNPFTDILTLSWAKDQMELRPDPESISSYPSKVLRRSRVSLRFPFPQATPDDKIRAMNTIVYTAGWWTGIDEGLSKWIRRIQWATPGESSEQLIQRVRTGLKSKVKGASESFFGELSLGSAGIDVPLELKITLAQDGQESR